MTTRTTAQIAAVFVFTLTIYGIKTFSVAEIASSSSAVTTQITVDRDAVQGHVLPFKIILAIRNFGFQKDFIPAQVAVSVDGGGPNDWMATGIYIAEHSIRNGAFLANVEVYVPNPWGDMPPTRYKQLVTVFYAPDPKHSPYGKGDPWTIMPAAKAGTLADIEFDKLSNDLISDKIVDPEKRLAAADVQARRITIKKYGLSAKWKPSTGLGLTGEVYHRGHVDVLAGTDISNSSSALETCLDSDGGTAIFRGCYPFEIRENNR